jgi:hypothetical protein
MLGYTENLSFNIVKITQQLLSSDLPRGERDDLICLLKLLDISRSGVLSEEEIETAAHLLHAKTRVDFFKQEIGKRGFPIECFPPMLQQVISAFDKDGDGIINESELAAGGKALIESREVLAREKSKKQKWKMVALGSLAFGILFMVGMFSSLYAVVKLTEQTSVNSASPVMTIKGTDIPVQVSSADTSIVGSILRDLTDNSVVTTGDVESYVLLTDLLELSVNVVNKVKSLEFLTYDGAAHQYSVQGVRIFQHPTASNTLVFYTSMVRI